MFIFGNHHITVTFGVYNRSIDRGGMIMSSEFEKNENNIENENNEFAVQNGEPNIGKTDPENHDVSNDRPEYEYGFDSRSGTYSYSGSNAGSESKKKKSGKGRGALVAALCICLVLSCGLGGVAGFLAASFAKNIGVGGSSGGETPTPSATVEKYTTIIENTATNQETAVSKAAAAAHPSVVIINVYASEEYEKVGQPSGSGSGVIWTVDGYIVTCNHVVENANLIKVTLSDGSVYSADVVGTDSKTDIAVLRITPAAGTTLTPAVIRASDLVLAETVIAIGNPLGVLGGTVTTGILSALERTITVEGQSMTLLQIDAAINSGNSGGGLFDINGSLIGIVNAKSVGTNVEGIGFAIPITTVKEIANELISKGYVTGRPLLGVSVVNVTSENYSYIFSAGYYPELEKYATKTVRDGWGMTRKTVVPGVYVVDCSLVSGYESGSDSLMYGDKLLYVGETEVSGLTDVKSALSDYKAGETISVTVLRNQTTTIIVKIILGQAGEKKN